MLLVCRNTGKSRNTKVSKKRIVRVLVTFLLQTFLAKCTVHLEWCFKSGRMPVSVPSQGKENIKVF